MKPLLVLILSAFSFSLVTAQNTTDSLVADPQSFVFNDGFTTVQGYVYKTLNEKTSCCGNDALYVEVKINEKGKVFSAAALTGKNECYRKSVVDILKTIQWDASGVENSKRYI